MPTVMHDSRELGYFALTLSIIIGYNPDDALEYIETGKQYKRKRYQANTTNEKVDMVKMKIRDGYTYREIGDIFGLSSAGAVYRKLKRLKGKRDTLDMIAMRKAGLYYHEIAKFYGDISKQAVQSRTSRYQKNERSCSINATM